MPKIELTDRFCASAKAVAGAQTDYFDTIVTGLSLRVSPAGTKAFYLNYTRPADGKRARMKLGRYPEMKLATARAKAKEGRGGIGEGNDPLAEKRAQAAAQTVAGLVENYIQRHASTKRSGDEIARRLRKNVSGVIGDIALSKLHRRDLTRCIDIVKDRGSGGEANLVFANMRSMVRWARARGDLDHDLADGMTRPTETVERDRFLSADEIHTVWTKLADKDMHETTRQVIRLCLVTAQRVGEVCGMTRGELDLDERIWTIPAARSKNGREHTVPLSDMAVGIIREQLPHSDPTSFVFLRRYGERSNIGVAGIAKAVKRFQEAALMPHWTPHDLRRSAATHMEEIGISPFVIGHVLNHVGHTKASITSRVYARYDYAREKREAIDLWADRLAGIIEGGKIAVLPLRKGVV